MAEAETLDRAEEAVGLARQLERCRNRLLEAGDQGLDPAADGKDHSTREWHVWTQTLPPIAFEIAREAKEVVAGLGRLAGGPGEGDDFS